MDDLTTGMRAGEQKVIDIDLVRHVAWALCNLRVLAHFVATMPDRFFDDAALAPGSAHERARDNILAHFREIAVLCAKPAHSIAQSPEETARLFTLLDELAQVAWPATADTLRITASYQGLVENGGKDAATGGDAPDAATPDAGTPAGISAAVTAYVMRNAAGTARQLARVISACRTIALVVFATSILVSVAVVFGKQFVAERDAIYRSVEEVGRTLYREDALRLTARDLVVAGYFPVPATMEDMGRTAMAEHWIAESCPRIQVVRYQLASEGGRPIDIYRSPRHMEVCQRLDDLNAQRQQAEAGLKAWAAPFVVPVALFAKGFQFLWEKVINGTGEEHRAKGDERPGTIDLSFKPWAETVLAALSTYILPVLFGVIGAWAASERQLRRRIERFELARTDGSRFVGALVMGGVLGGIVGLLVVGTSIEQASLSISAIALLAGFGSERTFRFLDRLVDRVFGDQPPAPPAPAAQPKRHATP